MRFFLTILSLFLLISPTKAQTVEDTIIYLFNGTDGSDVEKNSDHGNGKNIIIKKVGDRETKIQVSYFGKIYSEIKVNYLSIEGCLISMKVDAHIFKNGVSDKNHSAEIEVDMTKARSIELKKDNMIEYVGSKASCKSDSADNICGEVVENGQFRFINLGDTERVERAFSFYREKYCAGSAF